MKVNGEAIYKSKPWVLQNDTLTKDVWYTAGQNGEVYAILLSWPSDMTLHLSNKVKTSDTTEISFLHDKTSVIKVNEITIFFISIKLISTVIHFNLNYIYIQTFLQFFSGNTVQITLKSICHPKLIKESQHGY